MSKRAAGHLPGPLLFARCGINIQTCVFAFNKRFGSLKYVLQAGNSYIKLSKSEVTTNKQQAAIVCCRVICIVRAQAAKRKELQGGHPFASVALLLYHHLSLCKDRRHKVLCSHLFSHIYAFLRVCTRLYSKQMNLCEHQVHLKITLVVERQAWRCSRPLTLKCTAS